MSGPRSTPLTVDRFLGSTRKPYKSMYRGPFPYLWASSTCFRWPGLDIQQGYLGAVRLRIYLVAISRRLKIGVLISSAGALKWDEKWTK
jgi:hypothetical protein